MVVLMTAFVVSGCSSDKPAESTLPTNDSDDVILRSASQHFKYYSTLTDATVIDTIRVLLESNLQRVSALYGFSIDDTIDVKIYPDFETFHANVDWPAVDVPITLVGQCVGPDEIKFISPLNSEPINTYSEILTVAVHESMHAIHFHVYDRSGTYFPPTWIFEGFAAYESNQLPNPDIIRQQILNDNLPLIEQFNDADFFSENYGYHFCYTIFEYLLSEYGYQRMSTLLVYPTLITYCLGDGVTMETLNTGWHEFLWDNYSQEN